MGGYLTGKYLDEEGKGRFNIEKTGGLSKEFWNGIYLDQVDLNKVREQLKQLKEFAEKQLDCTLAHLAIAWSLKYQYTSTTLIGARNTEQLVDSLKALDVVKKLTPEL